jgi:hypothetical protein
MKIFADLAGQTSRRFAVAFAHGYSGLNPATVHYNNEFAGDDESAFFPSPEIWNVVKVARSCGHNYYYADHAYFRRGKYYRITRNAPQHNGLGEGDKARFASLNVTIKEWRNAGSHILICPNSKTFFELHGLTFDSWYENVKAQLALYTDRPLKVRWKTDYPIAVDLENCHAVIVFTSNSAVDAIMAGVPAFTMAQCVASRMSLNDLSLIEKPYYPEKRYEFGCVLASNQWTMDEIEQGDAWKAIGQ